MISAATLIGSGFGVAAAQRVATLFDRAASSLSDMPGGNERDISAFWVPGRIEFLGKHTDYAGGRSLVCAVDRGIALVSRARSDSMVRIKECAGGEIAELDLRQGPVASTGGWSAYPAAVVRRIARNFPDAQTGADIAFASDLPIAVGISSSSALIIAIFLALDASTGLSDRDDFRRALPTRESLAAYLGSMESGRDFGALAGDRGIGTMSGSQDQAAILCSRPGALVQYAFCPLRSEGLIDLPASHSFVIASSGVIAEKSAGAQASYNAVAERAAAIVELWNEHHGRSEITLGGVISSSPDARDAMRAVLRASRHPRFGARELGERFEQFVTEVTEIIPATVRALAGGELARVGDLVAQSQRWAEEGLRNQTEETRWLVRAIRNDAVAASAFGAGFGGSVWALVPDERVDALMRSWRDRYLSAFPQHAQRAEFFATTGGPPAMRLK